MKGAALLVIAFSRDVAETLAGGHVVRQKVSAHSLIDQAAGDIPGHHIHYRGTVVDAYHEWIDPLKGHHEEQRRPAAHGTKPSRHRHAPGAPLAALRGRHTLRVPARSLLEIAVDIELRCDFGHGVTAPGSAPFVAPAGE